MVTTGEEKSFWRPHLVAVAGASRFAIEQVVRPAAQRGQCFVIVYTGPGDIVPSLRLASTLPVVLVEDGASPQVDRIYVVPPRQELAIVHGCFALSPASDDGAGIDRFFRSLGDELAGDATCIVLSGAGTDGALGIKRVKEADGLVIAQAPADAEDPEMPLAAIESGVVDLVLDAPEIGARLAELPPMEGDLLDNEARRRDVAADTLRDILTLVRIRSSHDFSQYKRPTLYRRVARRMQVCQCASMSEYHLFLRDHPGELAHLLRDFLISVTNFYRDPDAFDALARIFIPKLFLGKTSGDQVRVWIAGCATGEEAYSIGMLLIEHASRASNPPTVQVFATDIDEDSLAEARAGRYPSSIAVDVSPERLARFFLNEGTHYRVKKELREVVLFSPHNLLRDPPFSRLDLVSCRNVLIYLNREAQDRVLAMFHFGLRPDGYLFLGASESAEAASLRFGVVEPKARIFTRRIAPVELSVPTVLAGARWQARAQAVAPTVERSPATSFGEVHYRVVEYYAPPSVLVNEDLDVLHMSEHVGRFLQFGGGEPTRQLLRLVHPSLRVELRGVIYGARAGGRLGEHRVVRYEDDTGVHALDIRVRLAAVPELGAGIMLVTFEEITATPTSIPASSAPTIEPVVRELEEDLQHTREQLRTSIEQYETSLEELKASNEELQAINEELRSATEELETSKEELQSVNEELTTLNHELKTKVDEVSRANSDLQNLMASTDLAVLFLDRAMNIKRFTRRALDLFNLIPTDIGRPISHVTHRLVLDDLVALAQDVLENLRVVEREVAAQDGSRFLLRVLPYRSLEDRIDGVVLTFVDITELRRTEAALRTSDTRFRLALAVAPSIATTHDAAGICTWAYALGRELPPATNLEPFLSDGERHKLAGLETSAVATKASQRADLTLEIDGVSRVFDTRVEPVLDGAQLTGLVTAGFDVTPVALRLP